MGFLPTAVYLILLSCTTVPVGRQITKWYSSAEIFMVFIVLDSMLFVVRS